MTTNDIDAIRRLTDAATDAPWSGANYRSALAGLATGTGNHAADADFIRAARTLVPALCDEIEQLREQLFAQKPVVDAAEAWAEMCEDGGLAPDDCRKTEDALHDAVEQYRLMDHALTTARAEQPEVAR